MTDFINYDLDCIAAPGKASWSSKKLPQFSFSSKNLLSIYLTSEKMKKWKFTVRNITWDREIYS